MNQKPTKKRDTKYKVPKGEEKTIVVEVEVREFDPETGQKLSKPHLYKADERTFRNWYKNRHTQGLKINKILHNPFPEIKIEVDPWKKTGIESEQINSRSAADV